MCQTINCLKRKMEQNHAAVEPLEICGILNDRNDMKLEAERQLDDLRRMEGNAEDKLMMLGHKESGWFIHEEFFSFATAHHLIPSTGPKADAVWTTRLLLAATNDRARLRIYLASNGCVMVRMYMIGPSCSRLI